MNREQYKRRISLTFFFAVVFFLIQMITLVIAGGTVYILVRFDILEDIGIRSNIQLLVFTVVLCMVAGVLVIAVASRIAMRPINRIIHQINRLAGGDYHARLYFRRPLNHLLGFVELSNSFNTLAQELENTEMLRGDFVNNFSHEFKTPIVSIAGFAKLLRRGNLDDAQKEEYLEIIEEESLRLAAMATNALKLTKVENQTILTDVVTYNLSEQLRSCVLLLEEKWEKKNLSLALDFDEYKIAANEELMKEVWINLLDNAIKFSPATGEIVVRIKKQEDWLCVDVTNFGSDIPPEKQNMIFKKFYQADESHAAQGNGVGLAIAKRVVELHQGHLVVESDNGKTTFSVFLPTK